MKMKIRGLLSLIICFALFLSIMPSIKANASGILKTTDTKVEKLKVAIGYNDYQKENLIFCKLEGFGGYDKNEGCAIFNIRIPKTFEVSKDEAKNIGTKLFSEKIKYLSEKYDLEENIDDSLFQTVAKKYMFNNPDYADLGRFIDIYENYDYNSKMMDLIKKLECREYKSYIDLLSDEDFVILISMMPIDTNKYLTTKEGWEIENDKGINSLQGYNGANARAYAQTWAFKTNNTNYGYYAIYNNHSAPTNNNMWSGGSGIDERTWNDCANYVSQCLYAGGATTIQSGLFPHLNNNNWYYTNSNPSNTWGGASNFQQHWISRVGIRATTSSAMVGDPASLDPGGDYIADHTVIITSVNGNSTSQILYACHSYDQFEDSGKSFAVLYNTCQNIWIYAVA